MSPEQGLMPLGQINVHMAIPVACDWLSRSEHRSTGKGEASISPKHEAALLLISIHILCYEKTAFPTLEESVTRTKLALALR